MEAFSEDYVDHNFPLVLLSGISDDSVSSSEQLDKSGTILDEGGFRVTSSFPLLTGKAPVQLLQNFLGADSSGASWLGRSPTGLNGVPRYRIRRIGRVGQAPTTTKRQNYVECQLLLTITRHTDSRHEKLLRLLILLA